MKWRLLKKIAIGIFITLTLLLSAIVFLTYSQIRHHKGSIIEPIDPSTYANKYSTIGIKNINLLSPDANSFALKNIVLREEKIHAITEVDSLLPNIEYIDGDKKYLIPGLIDTHVHLLDSKNDLYLYLVNGVTTICEMYGTDKHIGWKNAAMKGAISPDIFVASRKIGSRESLIALIEDWSGAHMNVTTKEDVREMVRHHKKLGYDALKLSSFLTLDMYRAILDESKKEKIPVIGHLSHEIGLENLYATGQAQLAHVEELVKTTMNDFDGNVYENPDGYLDYLDSVLEDIAKNLRDNEISVSTTIWLMESLPRQRYELEEFIKTVPIQYVNSGVLEGSESYKGWLPGHNDYEELGFKNDPAGLEMNKKFTNTYVIAIQKMTRALFDHGVTVLVGTDTNVAGIVPGFSIHDEMKSLSKLGISNEAILQGAITNAANFTKMKVGKIQKGYKANLVLLSDNPLDDIENTKKIEMVYCNGYSINKGQMEGVMQAIEEANNNDRSREIDKYLD